MNQTPILIAAGQITQRWKPNEPLLDPLSLMAKAAQEAVLYENIWAAIDAVYVVNILSYSYSDSPAMLAEKLGISVKYKYYSTIGGNNPQYLVNEICRKLAKGEQKMALLAGGEVIDGVKKKAKVGQIPDWPKGGRPEYMNGDSREGTTAFENQHDMFLPANVYPLLDTALRAAENLTIAQAIELNGHLYRKFAKIASENPNAWTQKAYTTDEITDASDDNRYITFPYTKRQNANISVDMASVVILTTVEEAERLMIPEKEWVYISGGADMNDVWDILQRPHLHQSPAIEKAAQIALKMANLNLNDITAFDIYSCFPVAVRMAMNALKIGLDDTRPLTLTGGLAFFGGPGNNYSLHSIVEAYWRINKNPYEKVMVTALGWYATKHSVGIYQKNKSETNWLIDSQPIQEEIDRAALMPAIEQAEATGFIEAYSIVFGKQNQPEKGIAVVRIDDQHRTVCLLQMTSEELQLGCENEWVGQGISVCYDETSRKNWGVLLDKKQVNL